MKVASKIAIVTAAVVAAVSIGGVSATWIFNSGTKVGITADVGLDLADFRWTGSEVLPTGEGSNHAELIERIVSALNGTLDGTKYENLIENMETRAYVNPLTQWVTNYEERNYYGSMDANTALDYDVDDIMTEDTENLEFIITWDSYNNRTGTFTNLTIYTTSVYLGTKGTSYTYGVNYHKNATRGNPTIPYGEYVYCVYKTTLSYVNSAWEVDSTEEGSAPFCWYEETQEVGAQSKEIPSFDYTNWVSVDEYAIGTSIDKAIWTFDGDTPTVYADSADEVWYYQMATTGAITMNYSLYEARGNNVLDTSTTTRSYSDDYRWNQAGTYNITTTALNATITVYDGSGSTVVTGTRYTPDITTVTLGDGSSVKTQTTTDTLQYSDGTKVITTYTITTTTSSGGVVSYSMTGHTYSYDVNGVETANMGLSNDTGEISDLTLDFYASTASYYYIEVTGATEIPLTITNTTATE